MKELKYTGVQDVCKPILNTASFTEPALQKGLVSSFLKFKTIESWPILVAKLVTLSDQKEAATLQKVSKKISDLNFEEEVVRHIQEVTGRHSKDQSRIFITSRKKCFIQQVNPNHR